MSIVSTLEDGTGAPDLAIDLGTCNTRIYARGSGLIADEPSVVMVSRDTGKVEAVGVAAANCPIDNRSHDLVFPLRAGVITDIEAASALLRPMLNRARILGLDHPNVLACAPTDAGIGEREAIVEAARRAGARDVMIAAEPLAAAIGVGMDQSSERAQMIVDVGDGVTDLAIIRDGAVISSAAIRTACSDVVRNVQWMVADRYGLDLHRREADKLLRRMGAIHFRYPSTTCLTEGEDCETRKNRAARIMGEDLADAIDPVLTTIVDFIGGATRQLPADVSKEIFESSLYLSGGGACLYGLSYLIAVETGLEVRLANDPLRAVINGAKRMLGR
jgi:rod shape-determining protein MreB and related proteins